ncbi:MAG: general secretion pathway protein GspF [Gammaproteobacteria bacterium]|nr:general secretion pathway protein GspF [Gammaproteobacteria bacterium]
MAKYRDQLRRTESTRRRLEQRIEESCRKSGHARPRTRREFLNQGLIAGVGTVFLPSIATILAREANAQAAACVIDNGGLLGAGKIPFLAFDQGGGANIAGSNVMVGGMGGQEDFLDAAGYAKLGLPNAIIPQNVGVDRTFGLAMHPNSALLRGMLDKTSVATRLNTNGCVIPARSENDTDNNPHNPVYGIARAGANGEFAATIGTRNSESGGRSRAPDAMIQAELRPVKVSNRDEAIGLGGGEDDGFPDGRVAAASAVLSALKLGKINEQQATEELLQCGYDKAEATFNTLVTPQDLDPDADLALQAIFPNGELNDGNYRKAAAAMKVVVNGYGGAGTIEYGGRDYHQDPRPETDGKDFIVGQVIGASLEYAAQLNKPLMIYSFSDGAVSADDREEDDGNGTTKFRWRSDNSQTAASFILVFNPNGQPVLRNGAASQQLGYFRPSGNVETASSPFANSVDALAEMVVLNYLGLHGEEAMFNVVLDNPGLGSAAAAAPYIAFQAIV